MALATLSIDLEARLAKLDAGMTQAGRLAEKNAARIEGAFARTGKLLTGLGAAAAGAFSVGAVVAFVRTTVEGIDALNDFADAAGTSVENASALEDAARRTGTGMDVVTTAAVKLNQTLKDATPDSPAAQALRAIGLSADELRKQDPAQALLEIAKALDGFADDGNKARLVMELFGKSAREVAPFLKDLAEQQTLVATVTTEQAKEAEKLAREWANVKKSAEDLARSIGGPLITALNNLFSLGRKIGEKGFFGALSDDMALAVATRKIEANARAMAEINNPANYGNEGRRQQQRPSLPDVSTFTSTKPKSSAAAKKEDLAKIEFPDSLQSMLDRITNSDEQKLMRLRDTLEEMRRFVEGGGSLPDSVWADIADDIAKLDPAAKDAKKALEALKDEQQQLQAILDQTPTGKLNATLKQIEFINAQFAAGNIASAEQWAEAIRIATGTIDNDLKQKVEEVDDVARELGLTFSSAFEDAIVEGEGLRDVLKGLEQDILRIVTRKLVTEPLANVITGALGGVIGGSSGGIGGQLVNLGGSLLASIFKSGGGAGIGGYGLPGSFAGLFADGGYLPPGKWGIAGERGPEPIFGGRAGMTVQPAGGVNVSNTFYLSGPVDMRTQQQVAAAAASSLARAASRYN